MSSEDKEAQEDELLALASIYDEDEFKRAESAQGGETRICLDLPQDFKIFVRGELRCFVSSQGRPHQAQGVVGEWPEGTVTGQSCASPSALLFWGCV